MTRATCVTTDPSEASLAEAILAAMCGDILVILATALFSDLADGLGGTGAAREFLVARSG